MIAKAAVERLKRYNDACLYINDREELFKVTRAQRGALHRALKKAFAATPKFAEGLGINPKTDKANVEDFEVHSLRRSLKTRAAPSRARPNAGPGLP